MTGFTVMTVGTFDRFHEGHRALLTWCRRLTPAGGVLVVGVNSDPFVTQYKHRETLEDWGIRSSAVTDANTADHVVANPQQKVGDSMLPLLSEWRPDLLVVGDDWMGPHYLEQIGVSLDELWALGVTLAFKPRGPHPVHSSQTRTDRR